MPYPPEDDSHPTDEHNSDINWINLAGSGLPSSPFRFPLPAPTGDLHELDDTPKNVKELSPEIDQLANKLVSIGDRMRQLRSANNSLSDFNESLGSLLMGLNVNAWCVHFENAPTAGTLDDWKELKHLDNEISEYESKIEQLELELSNKQGRSRKLWRRGENPGGNLAKKRRRLKYGPKSNTGALNMSSAIKATIEEKDGGDTISSINNSILKLNTTQR